MVKMIVANWKANPQSQKEAEVLFNGVLKGIKNIKNAKIIICPPFPFLDVAKKFKSKKIILGAQDVSENTSGPYTGEVPPEMLTSLGVKYVIAGHSSRRAGGETDQVVNAKILNLLKFKLIPIICIGENNRDHEGAYLSFVENQIKNCLMGVTKAQMKNIILTYEPVWAISSNKTREATKEEFMEMKIFIKKVISDIYDSKIAHSIPILYGGSVSPINAKSFVEEGKADGLLVGRDSLNAKKFVDILKSLN
ncbi:MAG: triose-phosphate isomerase [Candidatus Paceibacterota bacterium]|jgi:triosephosphate isomerase